MTADTLVQAQRVTAYVTGNADSLQNLCKFLAYLTLRSGREKWAWHHVCDWWLPGGSSQNVRKHNIFEQKNEKMLIIRQIDWREVGWPLSCNAFAIARFLVFVFDVFDV